MQLTGHLRGKALQEWNLLNPEDNGSFDWAMEKMSSMLGQGSHVMIAQNFFHTCQEEAESVSNYI